MDPESWLRLAEYLAHPQDLSQVTVGDTVMIHQRSSQSAGGESYFPVTVDRITNEDHLVYVQHGFEHPFNRQGEPQGGIVYGQRAYLPVPLFDRVRAWHTMQYVLSNMLVKWKYRASLSQGEALYRFLLTFPQVKPDENLPVFKLRRKRREPSPDEKKACQAFLEQPQDFTGMRAGQYAYWACGSYLVRVKITRTTRKYLFLRLPPEAAKWRHSGLYLDARNLERKINRQGRDMHRVSCLDPWGWLYPERWEFESILYRRALFEAVDALFDARCFFSKAVSDEQIEILRTHLRLPEESLNHQ